MSGFGEGPIFGGSITGRLISFSYGLVLDMTVAESVGGLLSGWDGRDPAGLGTTVPSVLSETSGEEKGTSFSELLEVLSVNFSVRSAVSPCFDLQIQCIL